LHVKEVLMEVEREITLPAEPEEVWAALTEAERLEEWFANDVELDAREGGEGTFRWDDGDERRATVRELDPPHRIVLDWDDEGSVTIELEEVEAGTRVHVVETSPALAIGHWATALELHACAWTLVA
jgi:uncharacterized protein YndB with AHSA1/START domain